MAAADALETGYVYPDRGAALARHLRAWWREAVDVPTSPGPFAEAVTAAMRVHTPDKHLRLILAGTPSRDEAAASAHGVRRVEVLNRNVGLLELHHFDAPDEAGPALAAAMQLMAPTRALVLDFRAHRGGHSDTEGLFAGFFCAEPALITTFFERGDPVGRQMWSAAFVPAPRYLERPVIVLTSAVTGSGAESTAHFLQSSGRATLVGETTAGAAHPGRFVAVHPLLHLFVASGRPESGVTGTNWEGVGVVPDHPVPASDALNAALALLG